MTNHALGALGVWLSRNTPPDEIAELAQVAERLGMGAFWLSGGSSGGIFDDIQGVLAATSTIAVGTSIANMYFESPAEATAAYWRLEGEFPGRFFLGVGPSHAPLVGKSTLGPYERPLIKSRSYLDALDAQATPVPNHRRLLSALGPLALKLASQRTLGTIPYLMPVAHTAFARDVLGPDALLAPELGVVLSDDPQLARSLAREFLAPYLGLPNYTDIFLRHGFDPVDLEGGGSERLLTAIFAFGSAAAIGARIDEHLAAGADHVAIQVLAVEGQSRADVLSAIALERGLSAQVSES